MNVYCIGEYSVGSDLIRLNKDVNWEESNHRKTSEELWTTEGRVSPVMDSSGRTVISKDLPVRSQEDTETEFAAGMYYMIIRDKALGSRIRSICVWVVPTKIS